MFLLVRSLQKTADILDGWKVGCLVIKDIAYVELDNGSAIEINETLEVRNGDEWQTVSHEDLGKRTPEGWPLLAGLDARLRLY